MEEAVGKTETAEKSAKKYWIRRVLETVADTCPTGQTKVTEIGRK